MADYPALPLFTDAYLADCHPALTLEQHGCYLVLMMMAWRRPSNGIPDNDKEIARKLAIEPRKWSVLKKTVLERFWNLGDDGEWHQKLLDKERAFVDKSRENGAKNAQKRWSKSRVAVNENKDLTNATPYAPTPTKKEENNTPYYSLCASDEKSWDLFEAEGATSDQGKGLGQPTSASPSSSSAVPQSEDSPRESTPTPDSAGPLPRQGATVVPLFDNAGRCADATRPKPKPKAKPKPVQDDAEFEAFWSVYPRRDDKGHARKAWSEATKKATPEQIIAGAKRYAAERSGQDPRYTKKPKTFLNAESWANDAESWANETPPAHVIDQDGRPDMPRQANGHSMCVGNDWMQRAASHLKEKGAWQR